MIEEMKNFKVFIFVGHFGSGKTEVAANYALELKKFCEKINIIDMDIINPFFRTADFRDLFNANGIDVVTSPFAGSNLEIPALPPNIPLVLNEDGSKTILDVGGDDLGARVLSCYKENIKALKYRVYCVINIRRPDTDSPAKIKSIIGRIEETSGLKVDALVNNTNLAGETSICDIIEGQDIIGKVSEETGIPIAFICTDEHVLKELPEAIGTDTLIHKNKIALPWD